ncbi:MAG TPA: chitin-binding protein [Micromonosporaceae bacterium]|nr:chitin-binding protein [Micromonosporaceae bacterium]HCU52178.1 chitin-binding protein [Micromonosporaceae bacterium]
MVNPVSRSYTCYQENPESPRSTACKAVVSAGGTQPLYDWNEVNIAAAAGNHRALIPDGKLCSAGRDKYKGLDLARTDWPTTTLPGGGSYTFRYKATAPHKGTFEFYVTRDGFNPAKALAWSDLESKPFLRVTDPQLSDGVYQMTGPLPGKSGRHLIYAIWQRSDSPEAFYSCSDVVFGAASTKPSPKPSSAEPTPAMAPAEEPAVVTTTAGSRPVSVAQDGEKAWHYGTLSVITMMGGGALFLLLRKRLVGRHRR